MTKLLILGADGLVGSAVRRQAPEGTVFVTRKDADLMDFPQTLALFQKHSPSAVINCAAKVGGIGGNMQNPGQYFYTNLIINANVMEAARQTGTKKLLTFLSTCIWPDQAPYPLNERDLHSGPPHPSNAAYAHAKRMIDVQSRAYRSEYGMNFITAVGTNIYGPGDNFSISNGHVLPSLIHKFQIAAAEGKPMEIWGSGKPLREFVLSDDVARLALWAVDNYNEADPIIFTSGVETSIKEVAELVAKEMGFSGELRFDPSKPDGQMRKPSDATKIKAYLPDFVFTPIDQGIKETVAWFKQHYPNVRK